MPLLLLFSGPIAVGKTGVAELLIQDYGFRAISSGSYLKDLLVRKRSEVTRATLQNEGDRLDEETHYTWLTEHVVRPQLQGEPSHAKWLIDAVRKPQQVQYLRASFPRVCHVHFTADEGVRKKRFTDRARKGDDVRDADSYDRCSTSDNERAVVGCEAIADITIDLSACTLAAGVALLVEHLVRDFDA